jgi:phosphoribosyl 1,2-cyclic phosphodiesterase
MRLLFLGTRGEIDIRTRRHRRHSALLVGKAGMRLMIDCGADWRGRIEGIDPAAILLTHAHRDHAGGLAEGAPCPVYATADTWRLLASYPIADRRVIAPRRPFAIGRIAVEGFPVAHSLRAPAVGYRIGGGGRTFFYVPDVALIRDSRAALDGVALYVGDGASMIRPILRRRDGVPIGHAAIRTQLGWCQDAQVASAVFTHCGSEIVGGDERVLGALVRRLGKARHVTARIAYDGLSLDLAEFQGHDRL